MSDACPPSDAGNALTNSVDDDAPCTIIRPNGQADLLLICDHASNRVPDAFENLGLAQALLDDHIGWDIGAAALTRALSGFLDAPAVLANFSRLVIDANRAVEASDLIPQISDGISIPGNTSLSRQAVEDRIERFHQPFHAAIETVLHHRKAANAPIQAAVAIHSFTPRLSTSPSSSQRPWHMGLLFDQDDRLAMAVQKRCLNEADLVIGMNEPYAPTDGVYYTLTRHGLADGMLNLLIEVRNDLLRSANDIDIWAKKLALLIAEALQGLGLSTAKRELRLGV